MALVITARPIAAGRSMFHSLVTRLEFTQEPKELGFTLEPPVVFYRIFIPFAIFSTESSRQRLTFLLDRQFFASLSFELVFMFCLKILYDFAFA